MINSILPCFYHPTKVIIVDDNRTFLDAIEMEFASTINITTTTDPRVVLQMLNDPPNNNRFFFNINSNIESDNYFNNDINLNIHEILNVLYDPHRFNLITILIVDYQMPGINGIELCRILKKNPIFKIMLTAEADKDIAIEAFNDRIIDKFLLKTSKNLYQQLKKTINELTLAYFNTLLLPVFTQNILFKSLVYKKLFNKILIKTNAVEYYIVDSLGSFLFLNSKGVPTWLIVSSEEQIEEQQSLLKGYSIPSTKGKILYLFSEIERKKNATEWTNYLLDAKPVDEKYFYSIANGKLTEFIRWDSITSYLDFMRQ